MNILALEPYYGGSHKSFLDGLKEHSSHDWTILGLPDYKWKWRMRHSAVTFAKQVNDLINRGQNNDNAAGRRPRLLHEGGAHEGVCRPQNSLLQNWDLIFCSDMLNLAEFKGLVNDPINDLPTAAYFHENQLTYPLQNPEDQDLHPAVINFTTCLAATKVWFNSEFHRTSYLVELEKFLKRMPDYQHLESIEKIKKKSSVIYPGIDHIPPKETRLPGPIRILWAARWEYDKDPDTFFKAIRILKENGIDFNLSVLGSQFSDVPDVFGRAKEEFNDHITHWGYQKTREEYIRVLQNADVVVSSAQHEFFGISMIEAITAGACPLLPNRLSYPELLGIHNNNDFFYEGSIEGLALKLFHLNKILMNKPDKWIILRDKAAKIVEKFQWEEIICNIDTNLISISSR